jgi:hypothetical protein
VDTHWETNGLISERCLACKRFCLLFLVFASSIYTDPRYLEELGWALMAPAVDAWSQHLLLNLTGLRNVSFDTHCDGSSSLSWDRSFDQDKGIMKSQVMRKMKGLSAGLASWDWRRCFAHHLYCCWSTSRRPIILDGRFVLGSSSPHHCSIVPLLTHYY